MKIRLVYFLFFALLGAAVLMGNKNGRASQANVGNTGAPGDETIGGTSRTCMSCHNTGPITAALGISVLDSANNSVTQFVPGQVYTARVTITASGTNLQGYGFQMIALRNSNNTDLDGFSDIGTNNYKIVSISNGRTYAEHDNVSNANTFNVRWTAPVAGTGPVTFYAAGNGVNKNNNSSGDGADTEQLVLTEMTTSAGAPVNTLGARVYPTMLTTNTITLDVPESGHYRVAVFDLSGHLMWENHTALPAGSAQLELPATEWPSGAYLLHVEQGGRRMSAKVVKM